MQQTCIYIDVLVNVSAFGWVTKVLLYSKHNAVHSIPHVLKDALSRDSLIKLNLTHQSKFNLQVKHLKILHYRTKKKNLLQDSAG